MDNSQIQELRSKLGSLSDENEELQDLTYLLMWLQSCKFNVNSTVNSIVESYKWRSQLGLKTMEQPEPPEKFMHELEEKTSDGIPVVYMDYSEIDTKLEVQRFGQQHIYQLYMHCFYNLEKRVVEINQQVIRGCDEKDLNKLAERLHKGMVIVNVANMSLGQLSSLGVMKVTVDAVSSYVKYFPKLASEVICIQANKIFKMMFSVLEPIFRGNLRMHMYGADKENKWMSLIEGRLTPSQIPVNFGGSKTCRYDYDRWLEERKPKSDAAGQDVKA